MQVKKIAIVQGSFDPISRGHLDIIERASKLFDEVVVLIAQNPDKTYMFSENQRLQFVQVSVEDISNASVMMCSGYVADMAKQLGATAFVRGVRGEDDIAYEQEMASFNFNRCGIETLLLFAKESLVSVSSTDIRNKIKNGESLEKCVPQKVCRLIENISKV